MRENLKNARKAADMTQRQVAEYLSDFSVNFQPIYSGNLIVCSNGMVFKKYKNGLYKLQSNNPRAYDGYVYISVIINERLKSVSVHRLIAETFIKNPNNYPVVNHVDGNKENNAVGNLEWCTHKDNARHMVNMHKQRYFTILKKKRLERGITTTKLVRRIGLMLGAYRDIENAVRPPTKGEAEKLERYFGDNIENLLIKTKESAI